MDYFDRLEAETHKLYQIANEARSKGLDVETETEVPLAKDLAERFNKNFAKYEGNEVGKALVSAGPQI